MVYAAVATAWMITGLGGAQVTRYVGLLSDGPAAFVTVILLATTARHSGGGALRSGWILLSSAIALYLVGVAIGAYSWLHGQDPFPGPADVFFLGFYLA